MVLLTPVLSFPADSEEFPEGRELIARSIAAGERNDERLRAYVNRTHSDLKQLAADGTVKSEETKTYGDVEIEEYHVRKLMEKNGKPLPAPESQREDARVAKLIAQRKHESQAAKEKREGEERQKREKDRLFTRELLEAFDYKVVGTEPVNGRPSWIIDAAPHPGYRPKELRTQMFVHMRGRLWIDREDLLWARAEAEGTEPFSIGLSMIAKLNAGARLSLEQARQPDGTWVVARMGVKASGRVALMKHFSVEIVSVSDQFQKVNPALRIGDNKNDF